MNMVEQVSVGRICQVGSKSVKSFGQMPRGGIAVTCGRFLLAF